MTRVRRIVRNDETKARELVALYRRTHPGISTTDVYLIMNADNTRRANAQLLCELKAARKYPATANAMDAAATRFFHQLETIDAITIARIVRRHREQARLAAHPIPPRPLPVLHRPFQRREQLRPRPSQRIHRAGLDQALDHPPVQRP